MLISHSVLCCWSQSFELGSSASFQFTSLSTYLAEVSSIICENKTRDGVKSLPKVEYLQFLPHLLDKSYLHRSWSVVISHS